MEIGWFICGFIAAIIYYKKWRTEEDIRDKHIGTEALLFVCGYIGLLLVVWRLLSKNIK